MLPDTLSEARWSSHSSPWTKSISTTLMPFSFYGLLRTLEGLVSSIKSSFLTLFYLDSQTEQCAFGLIPTFYLDYSNRADPKLNKLCEKTHSPSNVTPVCLSNKAESFEALQEAVTLFFSDLKDIQDKGTPENFIFCAYFFTRLLHWWKED